MSRDEIIHAWAVQCRALEVHKLHERCRMLEAALLGAMLLPRSELPDPKRGTTRAHGLNIMCPQTGALLTVDVDYEADEDTGIVPLYVWAGAHDIAGWMRPFDEQRLTEQIAARIAEDASEQRAELRAAA